MNPATEMLRRLLRMGFAGHRILDAGGALNTLYFARYGHRLSEVVLVWTVEEALAYRTSDVLRDTDPFAQPAPGALMWRQTGDVVSVVHALLSQPPQPFRHGPVPPIWTPPDGRR